MEGPCALQPKHFSGSHWLPVLALQSYCCSLTPLAKCWPLVPGGGPADEVTCLLIRAQGRESTPWPVTSGQWTEAQVSGAELWLRKSRWKSDFLGPVALTRAEEGDRKP